MWEYFFKMQECRITRKVGKSHIEYHIHNEDTNNSIKTKRKYDK